MRASTRKKTIPLASVSVSELTKRPTEILERVLRGERLIVRRHKRPLATIQPLNGSVVHPLIPHELCVDGSPLGDASAEADRLTDVERFLLTDAVCFDRIHPARLLGEHSSEGVRALEDMALRGLVRRSTIGWVLKGRGMMLREALLARQGRAEEDTWRIRGIGEWPESADSAY